MAEYYVSLEDVNKLSDTLKDIVMNDWFGDTKKIGGKDYKEIEGDTDKQKRSRLYVLRNIKGIDNMLSIINVWY